MLLQANTNPNIRNKSGTAALHYLVSTGHDVETVRLLVEAGAAIDIQDGEGFTPLNLAAAVGEERLVKALLEHGANPNIRDNDGYTVLTAAKNHGQKHIIPLLTGYGAV